MNLTPEQLSLIEAKLNEVHLLTGYSGVGKSVTLLEKCASISQDVAKAIVVKSEYDKLILNHIAQNLELNIAANIYTFDELIHQYVDAMGYQLFQNRMDQARKHRIIDDIVFEDSQKSDLDLEIIIAEVDFIQSNICLNVLSNLDEVLDKELQVYLTLPRKYNGELLDIAQKQYIWQIYEKFYYKILHLDLFDSISIDQALLRLLYGQIAHREVPLKITHLFIDNLEQFSRVQLDFLYLLVNKETDYYILTTTDPLKSPDRYHTYQESELYQAVQKVFHLTTNLRSHDGIQAIINSSITLNPLFDAKLPYNGNGRVGEKSVLTFFHSKSEDERLNVFFDRLDLLTTNMGYQYEDIAIVFFDDKSYDRFNEICLEEDIKVCTPEERLQNGASGLVVMTKASIKPLESKVVMIFNAENKKLGLGAFTKNQNVKQNYEASVLFYTAISNAQELTIIHSSVTEPSTLVLPLSLNQDLFSFELGSSFPVNYTLNIYRIKDYIQWIREQLINEYHYNEEDVRDHHLFDLTIHHNQYQIGIKILDHTIDEQGVGMIVRQGLKYDYIAIFDKHHYIVLQNVAKRFTRVIDFPKKD